MIWVLTDSNSVPLTESLWLWCWPDCSRQRFSKISLSLYVCSLGRAQVRLSLNVEEAAYSVPRALGFHTFSLLPDSPTLPLLLACLGRTTHPPSITPLLSLPHCLYYPSTALPLLGCVCPLKCHVQGPHLVHFCPQHRTWSPKKCSVFVERTVILS